MAQRNKPVLVLDNELDVLVFVLDSVFDLLLEIEVLVWL